MFCGWCGEQNTPEHSCPRAALRARQHKGLTPFGWAHVSPDVLRRLGR
jgi:hypothetical protein